MHLPFELNYVTLVAATAAVGACWRQFLGLFQRVRSMVIVRVEVEDQCVQHVVRYCWTHFKRTKIGDRRYVSAGMFVRPVDRHIQVAFEKPPTQPVIFWKGWRPILLSSVANTEFQGGGANNNRLSLVFLRGTFDSDQFIVDAVHEANEIARGATNASTWRRFGVHRIMGRDRNVIRSLDNASPAAPMANPSGEDGRLFTDRILRWKPEDIGPRDPADPMEPYAFPPEVEGLIQEATRWKASEKWHRDKRLPWRRGFLLYGKPGCGKSSLIRALAQLLDLPVYVYDLNSLSNEELVGAWKQMLSNQPAIAAMEDTDTCFHGRENVSGTKGGLTFDCLLNVLSGIEEGDGIFTVVTTNDISKIDPALGNPQGDSDAISTRPGRLDRAVELKGMTPACRLKVARRILSDCPHLIDSTVEAGRDDTGAQFTERCGQLALKDYWQDQDVSPLKAPSGFGETVPAADPYPSKTGSGQVAESGYAKNAMLPVAMTNRSLGTIDVIDGLMKARR